MRNVERWIVMRGVWRLVRSTHAPRYQSALQHATNNFKYASLCGIHHC